MEKSNNSLWVTVVSSACYSPTVQPCVLPLPNICVYVCVTDPGSGHPLHPEEHKEKSWCQRLAMVEALDHCQTSDRGAAH